jgi:hypothetical protein
VNQRYDQRVSPSGSEADTLHRLGRRQQLDDFRDLLAHRQLKRSLPILSPHIRPTNLTISGRRVSRSRRAKGGRGF